MNRVVLLLRISAVAVRLHKQPHETIIHIILFFFHLCFFGLHFRRLIIIFCIRFMFGVNVERPVTINHKFFYSFHSLAISRKRPYDLYFIFFLSLRIIFRLQTCKLDWFIYRGEAEELNGIFAGMLEQREHWKRKKRMVEKKQKLAVKLAVSVRQECFQSEKEKVIESYALSKLYMSNWIAVQSLGVAAAVDRRRDRERHQHKTGVYKTNAIHSGIWITISAHCCAARNESSTLIRVAFFSIHLPWLPD